MEKYECVACGYIYESKDHNDIDFVALPNSSKCPNCGAKKDMFHQVVIFDLEHAPTYIPNQEPKSKPKIR